MATIDNQQIPDAIVDEFRGIIDIITPASLLAYLKSRPELIKGFRPTQSNLGIIRKRLIGIVSEAGEIDRGLLSFLAGESFNIEFVAVFSEAALAHLFSDFAQYCGPSFIVAALLDEREGVRKLAFDSLQTKEESCRQQDRDKHGAVLKDQLGPFLGHVSSLLEGKQEDQVGAPAQRQENYAAQLKKSRKDIAALEKRIVKNKEENRIGKKLSDKIGAKESEIVALGEKLAREKIARKDLEEKLQQQSVKTLELQETLESEIRAGIDREMRAVVRGWLKRPAQRATAISTIQTQQDSDILSRVDDVLSRQEVVDRDYGNKRLLSERVKKLEAARAKIIQSGSDAFNPLAELLTIKKELDGEIEKIRTLLGTANGNAFIENIKIRINSAPTSEALAQIQELLIELEQNDILSSVDLKDLYMVYNRRMELLYERYSSAAEEPSWDADPGWTIKNALHEKQKVHLVVDGHNVIFGLTDLFVDFYEEGIPSARAREKLLELLDGILTDSHSCASVFFDGSVASERSFSQNVKEIYSGGGAAQVRNRADEAILDYLIALAAGGEKIPVIVVSNDMELQKQAREKGAKIMPLMQFSALLFEFYA